MKKILGWAILAVVQVVVVYLGVLAVGGTPESAIASILVLAASAWLGGTLLAAFAVSLETRVSFGGTSARVSLVFGLVVAVGITYGVATTIAAIVALVVFAAVLACLTVLLAVASRLRFRQVFPMFLMEGVGVYGTLSLSTWWPAAVAVAVLGTWWLWLHAAEKLGTRDLVV